MLCTAIEQSGGRGVCLWGGCGAGWNAHTSVARRHALRHKQTDSPPLPVACSSYVPNGSALSAADMLRNS